MNNPSNFQPSESNSSPQKRSIVGAAIGLAFGTGFGLIIGSISGSPALGLVFGAFTCLNVGAAFDRRRKNKSN